MSRIQRLIVQLSWAQKFMLGSLVVLVVGMFGMGWWVGQQIESGVMHQTAANTSLYVDSVVEPNLQDLLSGETISPDHRAALLSMLSALMQDTSLGQHITAVKILDKQGRIVYATDAADIGQVVPANRSLTSALNGWVAADIALLDQPENALDRDRGQRRLVTYSPVRSTGKGQIIAAVEFYQTLDGLDRSVAAAQQESWLIVGGATLVMYLLLAGFVRRASDTMLRQQSELSNQVLRLRELLAQNSELHDRVQRAAQRTAALNERFLRRISAELHDGPAQDLGLALLRLDQLWPEVEPDRPAAASTVQTDFKVVQSSLARAQQEIRAIAAGMGLPELENVALTETVVRAVRAHERRTGTRVALSLNGLPGQVALPVKITVYRIIQEALSNAYRHAGGADQTIQVNCSPHQLKLVISDRGPGLDENQMMEWDEHLGLAGMRERVESLGGEFQINSQPGQGTRVIAQLPLMALENEYAR